MTMIDGQLWNRCVNPECETLVPAGTRNYGGLCRECAPQPEPEPEETAAGAAGELQEETS